MEILIPVLIAAAVLAFVLLPLLRGRRKGPAMDAETLDAEVRRYRDSLRAETLCEACPEANPPGARFCSRCGHALRIE